jgi:iron-sulfur cluster assembly protein
MQPITITDNAARQIESLLGKAPEGTKGVRLNVKPTGCSGNAYKMEYIAPGETLAADDVFENSGTKLFIPKTLSWMLFGMTVDYTVDNLGNAKFEFKNPNESSRCGCGESFHVDVDELQRRSQEQPTT